LQQLLDSSNIVSSSGMLYNQPATHRTMMCTIRFHRFAYVAVSYF